MELCCDPLPDCADGGGFGETTGVSAHALAGRLAAAPGSGPFRCVGVLTDRTLVASRSGPHAVLIRSSRPGPVGSRSGNRRIRRYSKLLRLGWAGRRFGGFFVSCDALPVPLDLLRSTLQRADATGPAKNEIKEVDVGIFRLRGQVRVFHKSRYR